MQLRIQHYAILRGQAGRSEETVETSAQTHAKLYDELHLRHRFTLTREQLKVAVNGEFSDWSCRLAAGDAIVFIPPVAGGSDGASARHRTARISVRCRANPK